MKDYIRKYRNNEITPTELTQLRQKLNDISDSELSKYLDADWETADIDGSLADKDSLAEIKSSILRATSPDHHHVRLRAKMLRYAAIILIAVLSGATIYFYSESQEQLPNDTVISTGKGESACVNLPDGTKVTLFYESVLSYGDDNFTKDRRGVRFEGDGYFEVHADKESPFVIYSKGLSVTVLGTTFSLSARQCNEAAELYLEKGCVSLYSSLTDEKVTMNPNERASLNYKTGKITVEQMSEIPYTLHNGFLSFNKTPLSKVVETLEANFGCEIEVDNASLLSKTFSGTLPAKDPYEALEVLSLSFNSSFRKAKNTYIIY